MRQRGKESRSQRGKEASKQWDWEIGRLCIVMFMNVMNVSLNAWEASAVGPHVVVQPLLSVEGFKAYTERGRQQRVWAGTWQRGVGGEAE